MLIGLQWLEGFLLTIAEEKLNTLNIRRWFTFSDPLALNANVSKAGVFISLKISQSAIIPST